VARRSSFDAAGHEVAVSDDSIEPHARIDS
jgi:hypothetical protein